MKSIFVTLILCLSLSLTCKAQELILEGGKSITSFNFKDVLANDLENLQSSNHSYIDVGLRGKLFEKAVNYIAGFGFHTYGAVGNDNGLNNFVAWETTYASVYAGLDAEIFDIKKFSFHVKATLSPEFIIQGSQTLNNQVFDLSNAEDFDTPFIFMRGAASFEYEISDTIGAFFQVRYGRGSQLNKSSTGADLTYLSQDFGLGLVFNLKKKVSDQPENNQE